MATAGAVALPELEKWRVQHGAQFICQSNAIKSTANVYRILNSINQLLSITEGNSALPVGDIAFCANFKYLCSGTRFSRLESGALVEQQDVQSQSHIDT